MFDSITENENRKKRKVGHNFINDKCYEDNQWINMVKKKPTLT